LIELVQKVKTPMRELLEKIVQPMGYQRMFMNFLEA
jgi:hypothetical protein